MDGLPELSTLTAEIQIKLPFAVVAIDGFGVEETGESQDKIPPNTMRMHRHLYRAEVEDPGDDLRTWAAQ